MLGAEPRKLVMGVPLYGQSFTLADSSLHNVGDDAVEPGEPGELTQQPGILSYAEICVRSKSVKAFIFEYIQYQILNKE